MVDELSGPMRQATTAIQGLETRANSSRNPLSMLGSGIASIATTAAGFALGQGILALPSQLMAAGQAAANDAQSQTLLQQALRNTGQDFETYAGQLEATAQASIGLGFADEQTRQALSLLMAQTGDAAEAQTRLALAQDLARGTGMDLYTASKLLGKASDENANVLARYGIVMQKGADETELFAAVQQKFGGQAKAFAESSAGAMAAFQLQMGELQESLGNAVLPLMGQLARFAVDVLVPAFNTYLAPALQAIGNATASLLGHLSGIGPIMDAVRAVFVAFTGDAGAIGVVYDVIRKVFGDAVADFLQPFLQWFMDAVPSIQMFVGNVAAQLGNFAELFRRVFSGDLQGAFALLTGSMANTGLAITDQLQRWGQMFVDWIGPVIPRAVDAIRGLADSLIDWISNQSPVFAAQVMQWGGAFVGWITGMLPTLGRQLEQIAGGVLDFVDESVPKILGALFAWAGAFLEWVGPAIPPLLGALAGLVAELARWIVGEGLPRIASMVLRWGEAFVGWVAPRVVPMLAELNTLLEQLGTWIVGTALPTIGQQLIAWGQAFVNWIGPQIPPMVAEAGKLLAALGTWIITDGARLLGYNLVFWGNKFIDWVTDVVPRIPGALKQIIDAIVAWVTGDGGRQAADQGGALARNLVDGLRNGILNAASALADAGRTAIQSFLAGANAAGETHSPSRATARIGADLVAGMVIGLEDSQSDLQQAGANVAGSVGAGLTDAIPDALDAAAPAMNASIVRFGNRTVAQIRGEFSADKFTVLGRNVVEGLDLGILQQVDAARAAGGSIGTAINAGTRGALVAGATDLTDYIKQTATKYGIDAATALRVAMSEGGTKPGAVGDQGKSFGPFQLYTGGGLGNSFKQLTGLDPADIQTTWAQIDYAMSYAAEHGWSAWHGAAAVGISDWEGIGTAVGTANTELRASDTALSTLSASASTSGSGILSAMADYASQVNTIATDYQTQLVDLQVKTGDALAKNGQDAIDKIIDIVSSAQDQLNQLGGTLADPESYDMQLRAYQQFLDDKQKLTASGWTAEDAQRRVRRQLEDADRAYERAVANENFTYQRDLEQAKTGAQRAQLEQRHADRLADMARQHGLGDQEIQDAAKIAGQRAAEDKAVEEDRRKWIEENVEKPLTEFKQAEIVKRRDAEIAAAQKAADTNFQTISAEADKERAKLLSSAREKLADAKAEFADKIGPLTADQQTVIDQFLANVESTISGTLGKIPATLETSMQTVVKDMGDHVTEINTMLNGIEDQDVTVNVNTVFKQPAGAGVTGSVSRGDIGVGISNVDMTRAESDQTYRADLRTQGYNVGRDDSGKLYVEKMARGGIVNRPTVALIGEAGPEAVVPLGGDVAPTINVTVNGTVLTPTDLVDAIHQGLLRKKRGMGTLGLG